MTESNDNLNTPVPAEEPAKPKKARKVLVTAIVVLSVLLLLLCGVAIWGYTLSVSDRNLAKVYIDSIPVGGLTKEETVAALEKESWGAEEADPLAVRLPTGAGFQVDPEQAGALLGRQSAAEAAYAYGHSGDVFENLFHYLFNHLFAYDVAQQSRPLDETYIRAKMDEGIQQMDRNLSRAPYVADPASGKLVVLKGAGGIELDSDALYEAVAAALKAGETELRFDTLKTQPAMPDFAAILEELAVEPEDAYFNEDFSITPEVIGCRFDTAEAERLWNETAVGEQAVIPLELLVPATTQKSLEAMLYRDVLGTMTTSYAWSTPERINNIQLVADKLNGHIMLPGEVFSYNDYVGQRTREAGFQVAQAYSDGQVVEALGGGICQVSSTLYCATLYARLETLSRTNHYFKVSYIDYGLDATVSWGQPDFKFRNNRDYPIMIQAYTNPDESTLTIEVWGTDMDGYDVRLRHTSGEVYDEEYPDVLIGYNIHTYGDLYDANGTYVDSYYINSGVYYFHDEDIEWPEGYQGKDAFMDDYDYLNPT